MQKPFHFHSSPLEVIRHFTPNWFAMTMGTGITAICLNTLATNEPWLKSICTGIWLWNIGLFILFSLMFTARCLLFKDSLIQTLKHSTQPMFLGCIPMGLITIVNGFIFFGLPLMGQTAVNIAINLWWLDVALSIACVLVVPCYMFVIHDHALEKMTAVWLLPFVACEVAASSGGLLLPYVGDQHALLILVVSMVLLAVSVSLALGILVIFFQRLCIHKLPVKDMAASIWLPLGPTGTGALGFILIGQNAHAVNLSISPELTSMLQILPGIGLIAGTLIWALATWWFVMALIGSLYYLKDKLSFNLGFWAYTFPLGVYTMATVNLGKQTQLSMFTEFGAFLVLSLCIIWVMVTMRTLHGAYHGYLFHDPKLQSSHS
jgi:C4-dicarboxylate transporter/malic acid transport protein